MKKSFVVIGVSSICCVSAFGLMYQQQKQLREVEAEVLQLQEEKEQLQQANYEKIAESIKQNRPKTVVGEVFDNGYLKNMEIIIISYTGYLLRMPFMNKKKKLRPLQMVMNLIQRML